MTAEGGRSSCQQPHRRVLALRHPLRSKRPPLGVGAMLWPNLTTPLISLGRLVFRVTRADLNSRIIFVNALGSDPSCRTLGILGTSGAAAAGLQRQEISLDPMPRPSRTGRRLSWVRSSGSAGRHSGSDAIEAVLNPWSAGLSAGGAFHPHAVSTIKLAGSSRSWTPRCCIYQRLGHRRPNVAEINIIDVGALGAGRKLGSQPARRDHERRDFQRLRPSQAGRASLIELVFDTARAVGGPAATGKSPSAGW